MTDEKIEIAMIVVTTENTIEMIDAIVETTESMIAKKLKNVVVTLQSDVAIDLALDHPNQNHAPSHRRNRHYL